MINGALVFDCVAHVFNFEKDNALGKAGEMFDNHLYAFHQVLTPEGERVMSAEEFLREWWPKRSTAWSTTSPTRTC